MKEFVAWSIARTHGRIDVEAKMIGCPRSVDLKGICPPGLKSSGIGQRRAYADHRVRGGCGPRRSLSVAEEDLDEGVGAMKVSTARWRSSYLSMVALVCSYIACTIQTDAGQPVALNPSPKSVSHRSAGVERVLPLCHWASSNSRNRSPGAITSGLPTSSKSWSPVQMKCARAARASATR